MACYDGLGNLTAGGRWLGVGDFDADGFDELLMYYPADGNFWLLKVNTGTLTSKPRHHRLDGPRERARAAPGDREANSTQAWLPTRQAREGDPDRTGAGCTPF